MSHRVAINGFGRIGRSFFRLAHKADDIEIVAINDLGSLDNLAYLLEYDSAHGQADFSVETSDDGEALIVDGRSIPYYSQESPDDLPWGECDVDVAVESTGVFTQYSQAAGHLESGADHVVITANAKGEKQEGVSDMVLMGVNDEELETTEITSNASCTTNAGGGVMSVLNDELGIERSVLNTVHGYTASQDIVDSPNEKTRRGRAAAQNIVPSSTGSAEATTQVVTDLQDKFDGIALRVPVICGSVADITFVPENPTDVETVNKTLTEAAATDRWADIFAVTNEPLTSTDIIDKEYASVVDLSMTRVVDEKLVKILAWYDNEIGYAHTLVKHVRQAAENL